MADSCAHLVGCATELCERHSTVLPGSSGSVFTKSEMVWALVGSPRGSLLHGPFEDTRDEAERVRRGEVGIHAVISAI